MQTYDEMVDSGVDWIGDIPKGWSTARIGSLFKQRNEKVSDKDFEALSVTKKGVVPQLDDAAKTNDGDNRKLVRKGDYVINSRSDRKGSSGLSALDGSVSLINTVLAEGKLESRYTHHLLRSLPFQEEFYRCGQGIVADLWSTNYQRMKNIHLPVPGSVEQQKIADFLDQETAKIDNLIAKQERLLELLEERRRATITHAVTRGLNPGVELKETNIPWLGQVPEHWGVKRIKDVFSANDEVLGQKTDPNYGFGYVDISSVDKYKGIIKKEKMTFEKSPSRARRIVREGDIIIGAVRTYLEAIAQISEDATSLIVSTGFVVLRPKDVGDSDFYFYALRSGSFMANVVANSDGVSYPAINADKLMSLQIAVPPKEEMRTIIEHCKLEMSRMDELKQKIQTQITLLRERRTSLISHVVTGKVRV